MIEETTDYYKSCPFLIHALFSTPENYYATNDIRAGVRCLQDVCAWWNEEKKNCAVISICRGSITE